MLVLLLASLVAALSSRPFAGGWNDASRLATVDCLVDHGTFAIDDSIFVSVPAGDAPFTPADVDVHVTGTLDRMRFHGRYYSDKAPVPALYSAAVYKGLQLVTGLNARRDSAIFCWLMHFLGSGLSYVIAVGCTFLMVRDRGLPRRLVWMLTLAFAVGTVAVAYAKYVNAHILLLAVTSALVLLMGQTARHLDAGERPWRHWLGIGTLCGLGYTIDLGVGPIVCLGVGLWALLRQRAETAWVPRITAAAVVTFAAMPWVALHHAINYSLFGVLGPPNSNPDLFRWPGSPFYVGNMTGVWNHQSPAAFLLYALDILVGQRGFLGNNLMLYLAMAGTPALLRTRFREKPELLCGLFWCAGTFVLYAALSNNYAGGCLSIRWFVPLLAPGFLALALILRRRPDLTTDVLILTGWNLAWILPAWWYGPWWRPPLAIYWVVMTCGLLHWAVHRCRQSRLSFRERTARLGFLLQFLRRFANNTVTTVRQSTPSRGPPCPS
jgi:hypothetical protein